MRASEELYVPTDDECDEIDRAGLDAAWEALQPLKDDEMPIPKKVLACLRAFKAAQSAVRDATMLLRDSKSEAVFVNHYTDITSVVCSALMGLDMDSPDEIHPHSVLGERIAVLLKAAKALEAMSLVYCAFDDEDEVFGTYLADETETFAEAAISPISKN